MRYFLVLILVLLSPTAVLAKGECKADKEKFCKGLSKDEVKECLEKNEAELSDACKASREAKSKAKQEKTKAAGETPKTEQEHGTQTPQSAPPQPEGNTGK